MKNGGCHNVKKQREINNGDQYLSLDISLECGNLYKIKITSSQPKDYLGISGKRLITSIALKTIRRSKKIKKAMFAVTEVSFKDISNIIKEFNYLSYEVYARKRSKKMPTGSYFYLSR